MDCTYNCAASAGGPCFCSGCHQSVQTFLKTYRTSAVMRKWNASLISMINPRKKYPLRSLTNYCKQGKDAQKKHVKETIKCMTNIRLLHYTRSENVYRGFWIFNCEDGAALEQLWIAIVKRFIEMKRGLRVSYSIIRCRVTESGGHITIANDDFRKLKIVENMTEVLKDVLFENNFNLHLPIHYIPGFYMDIGLDLITNAAIGKTDVLTPYIYVFTPLGLSRKEPIVATPDVSYLIENFNFDYSDYLPGSGKPVKS